MPRSGAAARHRIQQAALELYLERGYDQTTTAEIAARAGVTERTYFRHFPDKREVLFGGEADLRELLGAALDQRRVQTTPLLEVLLQAFRATVPLLERNRPVSELHAQVIARTPALQERSLTKTASLTLFLIDALRAGGVADGQATLGAHASFAAVGLATRRWSDEPSLDLDTLMVQAFGELHTLCTASNGEQQEVRRTPER